MSNNFDKAITNLVAFLEKKKQYHMRKNFLSKQQKGWRLVNHTDQEYPVVRILTNYRGDAKQLWKEELTTVKGEPQKTLFVLFTPNGAMFEKYEQYGVIYVTEDNYYTKLNEVFDGLEEYVTNKETNWSEVVNSEEFFQEANTPNSKINSQLKQISNKLRADNLAVLWSITIVLIAVPIILNLFKNGIGLSGADSYFVYAAGGLNKDLMAGLGQWWRLFTYPFVMNLSSLWSYVALVIDIIMIYFAIKYAILVSKKWQIIVALICSIPMTGFIAAVAFPQQAFGGPIWLVASSYGFMLISSYMSNNLESFIARQKTIIIGFILIVWPLLGGDVVSYLFYFMGFFVGATIGYAFAYDYKAIDWTIILPIIILFGTIAVPIILIYTNQYVPAQNSGVFNAAHMYFKNGVLSQNSIIHLLRNYYGLSDSFIHNLFSDVL